MSLLIAKISILHILLKEIAMNDRFNLYHYQPLITMILVGFYITNNFRFLFRSGQLIKIPYGPAGLEYTDNADNDHVRFVGGGRECATNCSAWAIEPLSMTSCSIGDGFRSLVTADYSTVSVRTASS